jgi:hypothetical protein
VCRHVILVCEDVCVCVCAQGVKLGVGVLPLGGHVHKCVWLCEEGGEGHDPCWAGPRRAAGMQEWARSIGTLSRPWL